MSSSENLSAPNLSVLAPPPPPPLPGTCGSINLPSYKETKEKNDAVKSMEEKQFANLPDKLMNTMKREKKPFTYTPLAVGDNGKLDLNQIKSPKMKKRLMANMEDEKTQDENRIESIDSSLQNNKNHDKLDLELNSPSVQLKPVATNQSSSPSYLSEATFTPSTQTKQSLYVPLSVLNENDNYQNSQPILPQRETSLNYDLNRPEQRLDQLLNEQLKRSLSPTVDLNNNYAPSFYSDQSNSFDSKPQYYGNVKPKKINFAQELADERNFNCVPSNPTNYNQANYNQSNPNHNQTPKLWSNQPSSTTTPIQIEVQKDKPQYYSNPQLGYQNRSSNYSPIGHERSQSQQGMTYQIPIINQNSSNQTAPVPPQRQQSLSRTNLPHEKEIPINYEEPLQSKSFKILQKLTAEIEDDIEQLNLLDSKNKATYQRDPLEDKLPAYYGTLNHIEEPRIRSERRIPIQVEDSNNFRRPEYHSKNEQNWIYQNSNFHSTPVNSSSSFWTEPEWVPQIPAHKQPQLSDPLRYQGANIPSRTFRILQMLSNEDDW